MPTITDSEFGEITIRKSGQSNSMKATIAPSGQLRISIPLYVPLFVVKRMIATSRTELRRLLETRPVITLADGMLLGKSHSLHVRSNSPEHSLRRKNNLLVLALTKYESIHDKKIVNEVRAQIQAILRREAKHHLPHRLKHLAHTNGFTYTDLRFTHASTRWGSCNSKKAISLNIALMNLPFELIDYVLIHELCHTKHLNHSPAFWDEVAAIDPNYKAHRKQLKTRNPAI